MTDIFVEQLIKRKPTVSVTMLKALVWIAVCLIMLPLFASPMAAVLVPIALVFSVLAALFLIKRLHLEFEYALTNNELDVAVIIGQKKRKEMLSICAADIEFMAPICKTYQNEMQNRLIKTTYNAASSDTSDKRWFIIFRYHGELSRLLFEPNQKLIDGLERYNPSVVHRVPKD